MPLLVDLVAARMQRSGGENESMWRLLALLYERQVKIWIKEKRWREGGRDGIGERKDGKGCSLVICGVVEETFYLKECAIVLFSCCWLGSVWGTERFVLNFQGMAEATYFKWCGNLSDDSSKSINPPSKLS